MMLRQKLLQLAETISPPFKWMCRNLSLLTWVTLSVLFLFIINENRRWETGRIISNDVVSYYSYLPAQFIYHDLRLDFVKKDRFYYLNNCMFWPETLPNEDLLIKTTMGMSLFYAPFFFYAHHEAGELGLAQDGFSEPYQRWICLGCVLYSILGLWFLRLLLLRYFSEELTTITLLLVVLGSNYFYYATEETMLTHNVSFMLFAAFGWCTSRWHEKHLFRDAIGLGITGGLILLVRPTNLTACIFFLLYGITSLSKIRSQVQMFVRYKWHLVTILGLAILVFFPQLLYWKHVGGHWLLNPYTTERFYFNNPHVIDGIFSFRKGWLLYSPIMIFSVLGLWLIYRNFKPVFTALFIFLCIHLYVIFSWWDWWYGGSLGARAMVDITPLLCIPFAAFFQWLFRLRRNYLATILVTAFALFCIYFFQVANFQYRHGMLHWVSMTKESYKFLFLRTHFEEADVAHLQSLLELPDYERAKLGLDENE